VAETGGQERKLNYIGRVGCPDRVGIWPGVTVALFELKRHKKQPTKLQRDELELWRSGGIQTYAPDSREAVDRDIAHALANPILR
jgi:ribulose-5-phosphate 4-epimerase/fuculose-1-phosphate aldolase